MAKAAKRMPSEQKRKTIVTIHSGRNLIKLNALSYWQIVGETQFLGETRIAAIDAAKWCLHAKPGDTKTLPNGTTLEVTEA